MATEDDDTAADAAGPGSALTPQRVEYAKALYGVDPPGLVEPHQIRAAFEALTGIDASDAAPEKVRIACTVIGNTIAAFNNSSLRGEVWLARMERALFDGDTDIRGLVVERLKQLRQGYPSSPPDWTREVLGQCRPEFLKLTAQQIAAAWAAHSTPLAAADLSIACDAFGDAARRGVSAAKHRDNVAKAYRAAHGRSALVPKK